MTEIKKFIGILIVAFLIGGSLISAGIIMNNYQDTDGADNNAIKTDLAEENITKIQIKLPDREPVLSFVSGTEYSPNDEFGGTVVKLSDWKGDGINTDCYLSILFPDKSIYLNWTGMNYQSEYSNYYLDWTVPDIEGIYDMEVRCSYNNKNMSLGKGFHVNSEATVYIGVV